MTLSVVARHAAHRRRAYASSRARASVRWPLPRLGRAEERTPRGPCSLRAQDSEQTREPAAQQTLVEPQALDTLARFSDGAAKRRVKRGTSVNNVELLASLEMTDTDRVFAGPERRLDDLSSASSILTLSGDVVANHPTMGTCGCPLPPQPNTPPSPCGC